MSATGMEAVILAGGKGTRLRPYTTDLPKPLVPIGEQPVIEILLGQLKKAGVTRAHLAVNHLAHLIRSVLGDGSKYGLEIDYSIEKQPLSTVGPLKLIDKLPEHFIVANGDILTDLDVAKLYQDHVQSGAIATVATFKRTEKIDYGVLDITDDGVVSGFSEKPCYHFSVSMGIYVFSRPVLDLVPDNKPFGFDDLMYLLLERREKVRAYPFNGYWLDIGRPDDYEKALRDIDRIKSWSQ
jgi:NDP-sugar pyrophosphorylase family protein